MSRLIAATQSMDNLIQDLLLYSRLSSEEIPLQQVSLTTVVNDILMQLEIEIQQRQAVITVEQPLLDVIGNYLTLVQIISNLLSNAIKFVAPGVQPRVRMWTEARENRERGNSTTSRQVLPSSNPPVSSPIPDVQSWIRLWVEDNGIGIMLENQRRIFRVFERLHGIEAYPGTGIGLAIVRKGLERMGGRVGVESQLGQGSKFWIELPRASS